MVTLGARVYVMGGISSNRVHSFQFGGGSSSEWQTLPNLQSIRCYPAAIGIIGSASATTTANDEEDGCIYVFGGRNDQWQELNLGGML